MIDDIEDNSVLRRGLPVAHEVYGVAQTINTANYIYLYAVEKLLKLDHPKVTDVFFETGCLFFFPVKIMQLFSSEQYDFNKIIKLLALFFQIRDDLMNLTSEDMAKQKTFAEDLTEGKFSFPIIHSLSKGDKDGDDTILNDMNLNSEVRTGEYISEDDSEDEKHLLAPFDYIRSCTNSEVRTTTLMRVNKLLRIDERILSDIIGIVSSHLFININFKNTDFKRLA
ncbi:hypothetical protein WR25_00962 isoform B [Diploscapter pachys]|uniref:Uncharacterized protein n=1 Tax=Diploscapter pachys TaxID=2018661 RepID=A0A2A2JVT0_9BILA|nr:hypothetical protein WR25_00962 isoform B [Diploscapter pachys]